MTYYGDCVKMCEDLVTNFGYKRTGCCITTTHCLTLAFLPKNNMTVILHPPYSPDLAPYDFYLFLLLKIKLKGRHFDTIEVIEAELQAALNILTERNFHDTFKKMPERCIHVEGDYFEGNGGQ
jgi:hypothetical protein